MKIFKKNKKKISSFSDADPGDHDPKFKKWSQLHYAHTYMRSHEKKNMILPFIAKKP